MITDACKVACMARLEATYHDLGPAPEPGDNSPSLWRELAEVMKCAEDDKQLKLAVEALVRTPGRQFCPKPGDLSAAIAAESTTQEYAPSWVATMQCRECGDTGLVSDPDALRVAWCGCEMGDAERAAAPGAVDELNAGYVALEKKLASTWKQKRHKRGGLTSAAQIFGKLT